MRVLLAFAPFLVYAAISRVWAPIEGLTAAALVALALIARDAMVAKRPPNILEIGTVILFGGLAVYAAIGPTTLSVIDVRLCVDAGLFTIVVVSLLVGRPFTLQYAREQVPAEHHGNPAFIRTNFVITGVWASAFAIMVGSDLILLYRPDLSRGIGALATIVALGGAAKFTGWYPRYVRSSPRV